ncbi:MAG: LEA type 2 family protein [Spirochaetia bacterium]|nr:LEA type 2 family protein [Spirochaetia bacterium]
MIKKSFKKPKLSYEGMMVEKLEPTGASIRLYLGVSNRNNIDLQVSKMTHVVYLEDVKLLETDIKDKINIKSREKTIVEFPLQISFLGLKKNIVNLWENKKIRYTINSSLMMNTVIGEFPLNIKYSDILELPPLPELKVKDVKMDSMTFSEVNMTVFLKILNNNKIQLALDNMEYEIYFNNFEVAKGHMEKIEFSKDKTDVDLAIPLKMRLLSVKRGVAEMLKSGEIQYNVHVLIKGNSTYGEYEIPFDTKGITKIY